MLPLLTLALAVVGLVAARQRRRRQLPARAAIVSPPRFDRDRVRRRGPLGSVGRADAVEGRARPALDAPEPREPGPHVLALSVPGDARRDPGRVWQQRPVASVFLARPFTLLRFEPPEYASNPATGRSSGGSATGCWCRAAGRGCGFLASMSAASTRRGRRPRRVRIQVEVANFYPAIAAGFTTPVYEATQSAIHVLVTHAFLRSLAKLDLAPSKVGRLERGPEPLRGAVDQPSRSPVSARSFSGRDARRSGAPSPTASASPATRCVAPPAALVADALEHVPVGHAGGREEARRRRRRGRRSRGSARGRSRPRSPPDAPRRCGATAGRAAGRRCT